MPKKNRPNNPTAKSPVEAVPVTQGNCFAAFVHEAKSIGNEVVARRQMHQDFLSFLDTKGLREEWTTYYTMLQLKREGLKTD